MAERGANVTSCPLIKPSLFELVAQESLSESLYPAYRRICTWLANNFPENFGWLSRWFDEVYLAYNAGVELDSLLNHAASYSENFYTLQRVSMQKGSSGKLSKAQVWWSLASLCIIPYVRNKLETRANRYWEDEATPGRTRKWTFGQFVAATYVSMNFLLEGAFLLQYLAYLRGRSATHSPFLQVAKIALCYLTPATDSSPQARSTTSWSMVPLLLLSVLRMYRRCETGCLFFLQFLHTWSSDPGRPRLDRLPVPPPPQITLDEKKRKMLAGKCPVCLNCPSVPTVLPVSGYVFCFRCITEHLSTTPCCPVTKYPALARDLVRMNV